MAIGNLFKSKPWKPDKMPRDKKQGGGFGRATMAGATAVGAAALFGDGDTLDMAFGALALGITKDIFSGVSSLFASKDKDTNSNFEKINDGEKLQNRNLNEVNHILNKLLNSIDKDNSRFKLTMRSDAEDRLEETSKRNGDGKTSLAQKLEKVDDSNLVKMLGILGLGALAANMMGLFDSPSVDGADGAGGPDAADAKTNLGEQLKLGAAKIAAMTIGSLAPKAALAIRNAPKIGKPPAAIPNFKVTMRGDVGMQSRNAYRAMTPTQKIVNNLSKATNPIAKGVVKIVDSNLIRIAVAKAIGGTAGVTKFVARGIPLLGSIIGAGFAYDSFKKENYRDAAYELGGAAAGFIPYVGQALNIGASIAAVGGNVYKEVYGIFPEQAALLPPEDPRAFKQEQMKVILDVIHEQLFGTINVSQADIQEIMKALPKFRKDGPEVEKILEKFGESSQLTVGLDRKNIIKDIERFRVLAKEANISPELTQKILFWKRDLSDTAYMEKIEKPQSLATPATPAAVANPLPAPAATPGTSRSSPLMPQLEPELQKRVDERIAGESSASGSPEMTSENKPTTIAGQLDMLSETFAKALGSVFSIDMPETTTQTDLAPQVISPQTQPNTRAPATVRNPDPDLQKSNRLAHNFTITNSGLIAGIE